MERQSIKEVFYFTYLATLTPVLKGVSWQGDHHSCCCVAVSDNWRQGWNQQCSDILTAMPNSCASDECHQAVHERFHLVETVEKSLSMLESPIVNERLTRRQMKVMHYLCRVKQMLTFCRTPLFCIGICVIAWAGNSLDNRLTSVTP